MSPGPMVGGMQPTEESLRAQVCREAADRLSAWPPEHAMQADAVRAIWNAVIQGDARGMYDKAWCGAFALLCLKEAMLAPDVWWVPGIGFLEQHCRHTTDPKPGDIAYFPEPYQHHAIVTGAELDRFDTIDGNQPGIARHLGRFKRSAMFYSIQPLIDRALQEVANGTG